MFKQIRTVILEQEVLMCKLLIFHYRISIKQIIPIFTPNVFCSKHTISLKMWVQYMTKYDLEKISKTSNPFFLKVIWCNIGTSLIDLFNLTFILPPQYGKWKRQVVNQIWFKLLELSIVLINGSQLAKFKKSIPLMLLP